MPTGKGGNNPSTGRQIIPIPEAAHQDSRVVAVDFAVTVTVAVGEVSDVVEVLLPHLWPLEPSFYPRSPTCLRSFHVMWLSDCHLSLLILFIILIFFNFLVLLVESTVIFIT